MAYMYIDAMGKTVSTTVQMYCTTIRLYDCATVPLLYYYTTLPLLYCSIDLLYYYTTIQLCHCTTVLQYYCTNILPIY